MAAAHTSSETAFAQQGSLDWVALSNMPIITSIAILGRLSRAGLEPLTVAIAQAVCIKLPVGVQGEQRLSEAMSTLKMHGSFGNVVWFGVGIRHILRTLVQTSQGASSVALTAALSEGFSTHVAALVLYELPKFFGSPADLTPSFAQWQQYVQVCSGIVSTSGFGQKIAQHAKILGFTNRNNPMHWRASEAKDVAKFLRGISDILNGQTESMEVIGSMTCSWAFILCDYIFGLRVQLCRPEGEDTGIIFQNYDSGKDTYQIRFKLLHLLVTALPELKPLVPDSEKFIDDLFDDWKREYHETWEESRRSTIDSAAEAEKFKEEQRFVDQSFGSHCSEYLAHICSSSGEHTTNICCTMLLIAVALCDVVLDDPLELSRLGLARFYASLERFQESKGKFALHDTSLDQGLGYSQLLRQCLWLYTGDATVDVDNLSAMSIRCMWVADA
ncbi:hypothetical protein SLS56_003186 [Neofusicoccum ribis]|uniref:Uncharacterized protein n=1 Tax=Neofusicoccum ribis TaxID=45134 RepID=A0ABR3T015_9PEZI